MLLNLLPLLFTMLLCSTPALAAGALNDGEHHGDPPYLLEDGWRPLLNGRDLSGWHTCFASGWLVECCLALGDLKSAFHYAQAAVEVAERYTSRQSGIHSDFSLGRALIAHDRPQEACAVLERALDSVRERRIQLLFEGPLRFLLAEAQLDLGHLGLARRECDKAIAFAQRAGTPLYECDAQLILARVLLRENVSEPEVVREIGAALDRAAELIDQTGGESRRPCLEELHAELAHSRGDAAGREHHLRGAERLYTEMGATRHAERVAKEFGQ